MYYNVAPLLGEYTSSFKVLLFEIIFFLICMLGYGVSSNLDGNGFESDLLLCW